MVAQRGVVVPLWVWFRMSEFERPAHLDPVVMSYVNIQYCTDTLKKKARNRTDGSGGWCFTYILTLPHHLLGPVGYVVIWMSQGAPASIGQKLCVFVNTAT